MRIWCSERYPVSMNGLQLIARRLRKFVEERRLRESVENLVRERRHDFVDLRVLLLKEYGGVAWFYLTGGMSGMNPYVRR